MECSEAIIFLDLFNFQLFFLLRTPLLYKKALVSTFYPHLAYLIRQRDPNILMAMAWRPYFLTYETYNGIKGDSKARFDALLYHVGAVIGDILLKWSLHEWMWYFIGLSAVLIQKDFLTKEYLQVRRHSAGMCMRVEVARDDWAAP